MRVLRARSGRRLLPVLCCTAVGCFGAVAESAPVVTAAALRSADAKLPRPRQLPTISAIDWRAFPDDRSAKLGSSGRQFLVRPGKPGAIAAALDSAGKGDTVLLQGGTYTEGASGDYLALRISVDGVVLRSLPGQRARIVPRAGTKRGLEIKASNVLVHGIELLGFIDSGVGIGRDEHTVRNIILSDVRVVCGRGGGADGITVYPDNRSLKIPAVDGLLLRNVTVERAALGISCNGGPCRSMWLENVTVRNSNSGGGSGADAIGVEEGDNIVIVNTEATGASADGIDLKAKRVLIYNSSVHHIARNGIKLWHGGDVINTLVHHTGADAAINFKFAGRYRFLHSVMAFHNYRAGPSYNLTAGYDTREHLDVDLVNSIFYNTSGGMFFSDNTALRVDSCIFHGMENRNVLRARAGGRELELTLGHSARALEKARLGSGNLYVDPKFVDGARGDFHLRRDSPGRDRGRTTPKGYPPTDKEGAARVVGNPDLGPFEAAP